MYDTLKEQLIVLLNSPVDGFIEGRKMMNVICPILNMLHQLKGDDFLSELETVSVNQDTLLSLIYAIHGYGVYDGYYMDFKILSVLLKKRVKAFPNEKETFLIKFFSASYEVAYKPYISQYIKDVLVEKTELFDFIKLCYLEKEGFAYYFLQENVSELFDNQNSFCSLQESFETFDIAAVKEYIFNKIFRNHKIFLQEKPKDVISFFLNNRDFFDQNKLYEIFLYLLETKDIENLEYFLEKSHSIPHDLLYILEKTILTADFLSYVRGDKEELSTKRLCDFYRNYVEFISKSKKTSCYYNANHLAILVTRIHDIDFLEEALKLENKYKYNPLLKLVFNFADKEKDEQKKARYIKMLKEQVNQILASDDINELTMKYKSLRFISEDILEGMQKKYEALVNINPNDTIDFFNSQDKSFWQSKKLISYNLKKGMEQFLQQNDMRNWPTNFLVYDFAISSGEYHLVLSNLKTNMEEFEHLKHHRKFNVKKYLIYIFVLLNKIPVDCLNQVDKELYEELYIGYSKEKEDVTVKVHNEDEYAFLIETYYSSKYFLLNDKPNEDESVLDYTNRLISDYQNGKMKLSKFIILIFTYPTLIGKALNVIDYENMTDYEYSDLFAALSTSSCEYINYLLDLVLGKGKIPIEIDKEYLKNSINMSSEEFESMLRKNKFAFFRNLALRLNLNKPQTTSEKGSTK